jgi:hypothetical protein
MPKFPSLGQTKGAGVVVGAIVVVVAVVEPIEINKLKLVLFSHVKGQLP